jgi:hypothetical protein
MIRTLCAASAELFKLGHIYKRLCLLQAGDARHQLWHTFVALRLITRTPWRPWAVGRCFVLSFMFG